MNAQTPPIMFVSPDEKPKNENAMTSNTIAKQMLKNDIT